MACYVTPMRPTEKTRRWPYQESCYLVCDTQLGLDDMGVQIGCKASWKQHPLTCREHFDLTSSMRRWAIKRGAHQITLHELGRIMARKCQQWPR